jgi:uncharacterized Rossmann fold enzyme
VALTTLTYVDDNCAVDIIVTDFDADDEIHNGFTKSVSYENGLGTSNVKS